MTGSAVASIHPSKINIEPENDGLEDDFPLPGVYIYIHIFSSEPCYSSGVYAYSDLSQNYNHFQKIVLPCPLVLGPSDFSTTSPPTVFQWFSIAWSQLEPVQSINCISLTSINRKKGHTPKDLKCI